MTNQEKRRFAAEVIRLMQHHVPKERRPRVAWTLVVHDVDEDGVHVVSVFGETAQTATFLRQMADIVQDGDRSIPIVAAPEPS